MTLTEVQSDESLRQREFPVTRDQVFLAHAAVCPLPRRVAEAIRSCAEQGSQADQEKVPAARILEETRALAARLLNAAPEEIAFVGPTSLALSFVAGGLDSRKGDNVLIYLDDYPSNVYLRSRWFCARTPAAMKQALTTCSVWPDSTRRWN
jgi:selenocysteine lyase/cysteine desulfurase